jgi:hypothetical protein
MELAKPEKVQDLIDEFPEHLFQYDGQDGRPLSDVIRSTVAVPDEDTDSMFGEADCIYPSLRDAITARGAALAAGTHSFRLTMHPSSTSSRRLCYSTKRFTHGLSRSPGGTTVEEPGLLLKHTTSVAPNSTRWPTRLNPGSKTLHIMAKSPATTLFRHMYRSTNKPTNKSTSLQAQLGLHGKGTKVTSIYPSEGHDGSCCFNQGPSSSQGELGGDRQLPT